MISDENHYNDFPRENKVEIIIQLRTQWFFPCVIKVGREECSKVRENG